MFTINIDIIVDPLDMTISDHPKPVPKDDEILIKVLLPPHLLLGERKGFFGDLKCKVYNLILILWIGVGGVLWAELRGHDDASRNL